MLYKLPWDVIVVYTTMIVAGYFFLRDSRLLGMVFLGW